MNPTEPPDFGDSFPDQPSRPPLADDLERAQRYRRAALTRRTWAVGLATAAGLTVIAVVVALAAPAATQTAVPAAPPASSQASTGPTEEPTSDWPTREQMAAQQRVDKALEPMSKIVKNDGANDPHYASSSVSIEDQTATIYWKGEVPKLIRDLEGTTATGVKVSVIPATYSQRDASTAARLLFAASRRGTIPPVKSAGLSNTGDALVVGFSRADLDQFGTEELSRKVRTVTDMGFRLIEGRDIDGGVDLPAPYPRLTDGTVAALRAQGTDVTLVDSDQPSDLAVKAAGGSADKRPAEVSLARVTVRDYARVTSKDPNAAGKRLIEDRLVWVVVFPKQSQPIGGPAPAPGQQSSGPARTQLVSLAVLVDPDTNTFLFGETFG